MEADDDDTQLSIGMELAKLEVGYYTINCGLNKLSPFCLSSHNQLLVYQLS